MTPTTAIIAELRAIHALLNPPEHAIPDEYRHHGDCKPCLARDRVARLIDAVGGEPVVEYARQMKASQEYFDAGNEGHRLSDVSGESPEMEPDRFCSIPTCSDPDCVASRKDRALARARQAGGEPVVPECSCGAHLILTGSHSQKCFAQTADRALTRARQARDG